jgi:hypothetical protein
MDSNVNDVFDKTEKRSDNSTKEDDPQLTPKAIVTPSRVNIFASTSTAPGKPNTTLPKIPDSLTAELPAHRALICSIPPIFKAYVKELQAAIPAGVGPDGDLLSMIIVNKYGYVLKHIDELEEDLHSLYYEAIDRNDELERLEAEEKERKDKELVEKKGRKGMDRYL